MPIFCNLCQKFLCLLSSGFSDQNVMDSLLDLTRLMCPLELSIFHMKVPKYVGLLLRMLISGATKSLFAYQHRKTCSSKDLHNSHFLFFLASPALALHGITILDQNIWQKVRSMWSYVYDNYYEKYDWFHIG